MRRALSRVPAELADEVRQRQFHLLTEQLPVMFLANVGLGLLLAYIVSDVVPATYLAGWLVILGLSLIPSLRAWLALRSRAPRQVSARFPRRAFINAVLTAAPWGLAALLPIPAESPLHLLALVFVIAGITAGSMATLSSVPAACWGYLLTAVVPLMLRLVVTGERISVVMAAMLLAYLAWLLYYQQKSWRQFLDAVEADVDKTRLVDELTEARERLSATAAELEVRVDERTAELASSEARLRTLIDNSTDIIVQFDLSGEIQDVSPSATRVLGYALEDIKGTSLFQLLHPDDVPRAAQALASAFDDPGGVTDVMRIRVRHKAGGWRIFEVIGRNLSEDPTIGAVIVNARDVTGTVEATAALQARERELRMIAGNLPGAIFRQRLSADDRISYDAITGAGLERFGVPADEETPLPADLYEALTDPADRPRVEKALRDSAAHLTPLTLDYRWRTPNGEVRWMRGVSQPYREENGDVIWDGLLLDVSDERSADQRLQQAQKMEAIGKLTGGIAHDFNNYLMVVIGNLELLKAHYADDDTAVKYVDNALAGAARGGELTKRLLAYARQQTLAPEPTDVNNRLAAIEPLLRRALREDIDIDIAPARDLWPVLIDGAQLDSCIVNLANNARDAMPNGGSFRITTRNTHDDPGSAVNSPPAEGDYVLIEVTDTGEGMTAEVAAKVFEPFFTTKGVGHGTGLGLSMVYGFVKQSDGYIQVVSKPDEGTIVRIYLPRQSSDVVAAREDTAASQAPHGNETILIVEDDEEVRRVVAAQLTLLDYHTIEAANGDAALAIVEQPDVGIDLLFTDMVMPGQISGGALADRATTCRPGLKVLLTSGFWRDAPADHAPRYRLLHKPYGNDELATAIRETLDAPV